MWTAWALVLIPYKTFCFRCHHDARLRTKKPHPTDVEGLNAIALSTDQHGAGSPHRRCTPDGACRRTAVQVDRPPRPCDQYELPGLRGLWARARDFRRPIPV